MGGKYWSWYNCSASGCAHLSTEASTVLICAFKSTDWWPSAGCSLQLQPPWRLRRTSSYARDLDDEAKEDTEDGSTVEALPVSDREAARSDGSIGVISGVIVSLLAVVVIMTVLGVKLYRRRKSHQAIISYLQSVGHIEPLNLKKSCFRIKLFVTIRLPQHCKYS